MCFGIDVLVDITSSVLFHFFHSMQKKCFEINIENVTIIRVSVKNENILQENSYPLKSVLSQDSQLNNFFLYVLCLENN
jgi:hypothetical protein